MRSSLRRRVAATAVAAVTLVCLAPASSAVAGAGPTSGTGSDPTLHSIVAVLRDQLQAQPATHDGAARRASSGSAAQNTVLRRLAGRTPTDVRHFVLANAFSATVTGDQVAALRLDPAVVSVGDNVAAQPPTATTSVAGSNPVTPSAKTAAAAPAPYQVPASACRGTKAKPQLEPEGLEVIGARSDDPTAKTAAALGYDGAGTRIGFLADHLDPGIADFRRADGTSAIVENTSFDPAGSNVPGGGGEAYGDAGTIAAQGRVAHDLAAFANPAAVRYPNGHCWIRIEGVAPGSSVVAMSEAGNLVNVLQAIDHAVTVSRVDVLNESFGVNAYPEASARNALAAANAAAAAAGTTVVASTGDAGVNSTIASPAASSAAGVINVGASTHYRARVQIGGSGLSITGATTWGNDQISDISSSGVTSDGHTVDLVAPGDGGWAPCTTDLFQSSECASLKNRAVGAGVEFFAGTSQAAPFTSGTAALVIQAYRATHHGTSPSPAVVEQIITSTATDLRATPDQQGTGRLNARAAVEAALSWTGTTGAPTGVTRAVVTPDVTQVSASGAPGSTVTVPVTFRNTSTRPVRLSPALRALTTVSTTTIDLPLTADTAAFIDLNGSPQAAATTTIAVAKGTDRLRVATSGAPAAATTTPWLGPVISLYDPAGSLVATGLQQSADNAYDEVSADRPTPGTWTAVVSEPVGSPIASVQLRADRAVFKPVAGASVTPSSATLTAGGSGTLLVTAPVSAAQATAYTLDPGLTVDKSTAVGAGLVTITTQPVLAPTPPSPATFTTQLRGGNGRDASPAQTASYLVQVPSGVPTLTAELTAPRCGCELVGLLIDPAGRVRSSAVNEVDGTPVNGLTQNVAAPDAGTWRYVVLVSTPTVRTTATATMRGTMSLTPAAASGALPGAGGPDSLAAGRPTTVPVTITNRSTAAPITVFLDAQTNTLVRQPLQATTAPAFTLPFQQFGDASAYHQYLVPPGTQRITANTTATTPVQTSWQSPWTGDFAVGAPSTTTTPSTVQITRPSQGLWLAQISQVGPFPTVAPSGSGSIKGTAIAPAFDPTVTSSAGPLYGPGDGAPVTIAPGATVQIQVTITPTAAAVGTTVSGRLVVSTGDNSATQSGRDTGFDVLAQLPYRYTVTAPPARG